jgi:class 3 adenylate cyclase/tetratricopeptide (TPR) repeat protein
MPICPKCGQENPEIAGFCSACGSPLSSDQPPGREVRKAVTVLFCDLTGSTSLGEGLDPESLRRVMQRYFDAMNSVLERHGGVVEKFIGDAVVAVFGIPRVHDDDALRAVRAAAEMRLALSSLNDELEQRWGVRLAIRIGINSGEVVAGDASLGQALVTGDAVNVAARLEETGRAGEILIGNATQRLVRNAVLVEPVDPLMVKGKTEAVRPWRLLAVLTGASPFARRLDSRLVGRESETALLEAAFRRVASDRACHLFTVLGSAGVGKSRLVDEVARTIEVEATVVRGRCLPYGEGITFWPVAEVVREAAGLSRADAPEEARAKIAALLVDDEHADLVSERVTQMLGLADVAAGPEESFWALRRLLEALARRRPLVVIFDDIQWGEPTFLDLVEYLAAWMRDSPILLVCLARTELLDERPAWAAGTVDAAAILLEPLSESECEQLMENLLGQMEPIRDTQQRIARAAGGNPLFVEEMLAMLIDDGLLHREDGSWSAAADLSTIEMPETIQALLAARLDHLEPQERHVIERAAVEGGVFHMGAVAELCAPEARPQVTNLLMALARRHLIGPDRSSFVGEECFRFHHILVRDAAYRGMPKELRAELHERFAAWLERVANDRVREWEEILGYHLEQAYRYRSELRPVDAGTRTLARRAGDRLASAGQRAILRVDMPAAASLLSRAARLYDIEAPERLELLPELGAALIDVGELADASVVLDDAIRLARSAGDARIEWRAVLELAEMGKEQRAADQLRQQAERAIRVFEEHEDDKSLSKAWRLVGESHLLRCRGAAAEEALRRAVTHARAAGDLGEETESLRWLARAMLLGPVPVGEGIARCEAARTASGGRPISVAGLSLILGAFAGMQGRFDDARGLIATAQAIFSELGLTFRLAQSAFVSGRVELLADEPAAAERELRRGYEILESMGEKSYYFPILTALLADAVCAQGRWQEALFLTEVSERSATPGDLAASVLWRAVRGKALCGLGNTEQGEGLARESVRLGEESDFLWDRANALMNLADILTVSGRAADAAGVVQKALHLYEQKGIDVSANRARSLLAEPVEPVVQGSRPRAEIE